MANNSTNNNWTLVTRVIKWLRTWYQFGRHRNDTVEEDDECATENVPWKFTLIVHSCAVWRHWPTMRCRGHSVRWVTRA